jgi:hypothetical protein
MSDSTRCWMRRETWQADSRSQEIDGIYDRRGDSRNWSGGLKPEICRPPEVLIDTEGQDVAKIFSSSRGLTILPRRRMNAAAWAKLRLEHFKVGRASYGGRGRYGGRDEPRAEPPKMKL